MVSLIKYHLEIIKSLILDFYKDSFLESGMLSFRQEILYSSSFPEGKLDDYLRIFDEIFHSVVGFFNDSSCKSCKVGWREIR
jgi:hypothetical protein